MSSIYINDWDGKRKLKFGIQEKKSETPFKNQNINSH